MDFIHLMYIFLQIDPISEVRRLNQSETTEVTKFIKLKCSRPKLIEYINENYQKNVYSYDIKNLMAKLRKSINKDDLDDAFSKLSFSMERTNSYFMD